MKELKKIVFSIACLMSGFCFAQTAEEIITIFTDLDKGTGLQLFNNFNRQH